MTVGEVLVLSGPPCSGKSSVGRTLTADTPADGQRRSVHIEVDALFSLLLPASDRSRADRMLAYDAAHVLAVLFLQRGQSVVLECTYARVEQRASLQRALADVPAAPLHVVEFFISSEEAVRRFRRREQPTDLDDELVRERVEAFPYWQHSLQLRSSAAAPHDLAAQIRTWLRHEPPSVRPELWAQAGRGWH
jgi:predicted kinase